MRSDNERMKLQSELSMQNVETVSTSNIEKLKYHYKALKWSLCRKTKDRTPRQALQSDNAVVATQTGGNWAVCSDSEGCIARKNKRHV